MKCGIVILAIGDEKCNNNNAVNIGLFFIHSGVPFIENEGNVIYAHSCKKKNGSLSAKNSFFQS